MKFLWIFIFLQINDLANSCNFQLNEECSCSHNNPEYWITCIAKSNKSSFFDTSPLQAKSSLIYKISLLFKSYSKIPVYAFRGIRFIGISLVECQIECIDENAFTGILELRDLSLRRNKIKSLGELFVAFAKLSYQFDLFNKINLDENEIETLNIDFPKIMENFTNIFLNKNKFTYLTSSVFKSLKSLNTLELSQNSIKQFDQTCFGQLGKLSQLKLNYMKYLEYIDNDGFFEGLGNLEVLRLQNGNLRKFGILTLDWLVNLKELYLDFNMLDFFQIKNKNLTFKLEIVNLAANQLESVTNNMFTEFKNLKTLDLSLNEIIFLESDSFMTLTKLENLKLNNNKIRQIEPFTFSKLTSLLNLYLSSNKIEEVSNGTFLGLIKLRDLDTSLNNFKKIGKYSFSSLKSLTTKFLALEAQQIRFIEPFAFDELKSLQNLLLSKNRLRVLYNNSFAGLTSLKELELNDNLIKLIERDAFTGLFNLISLFLHSNQIERLEIGTFRDLTHLEDLVLITNALKIIQPLLFQNLSSLKLIELGSNPIELFEKTSLNFYGLEKQLSTFYFPQCKLIKVKSFYFSRLVMLTFLDLSENKISSLEFDSFTKLIQLLTIDLSNNFIFKLDSRLFQANKKLKSINLAGNVLLKIELQTFRNIPNLVSLNLRSNQIYNLTYLHIMNSTKLLKSLNLASNFLTELSLFSSSSYNFYSPLVEILLSNNQLFKLVSYQQLYNLDISNNPMLRAITLSQLTYLDLTNSKNVFELENHHNFTTGLKSLVLANTSTFLISRTNFSEFLNLQILDLSFNKLDSETISQIKYIKSLRIIILQSTSITRVDEFLSLANLEEVNFGFNEHLIINGSNFLTNSAPKLKKLTLCRIGNLSEVIDLSKFKSLDYLNLSSNNLSVIKREHFSNNENLKFLNLSNNRISVIERGSFSATIYLSFLDLSSNRIADFEEITTLSRLISLSIQNNFLVKINFNCPFIEEVRLFKNNIIEVPRLTSDVLFLYLSYNQIDRVTNSSLQNLIKMKELELDNNNIDSIDSRSFNSLRKIKRINLAANRLKFLDDRTFEELYLLEYLNLSRNFFESLSLSLLSDLNSLVILDLSLNSIKFVEDFSFSSTTSLKILHLNQHATFNLTNQTLAGLEAIKEIYISEDFVSQENFFSIVQSVKVNLVKNSSTYVYFSSINFIFMPRDFQYTIDYCYLSLAFAKFGLSLNLERDDDEIRFFANCNMKLDTN